MNKIIDQILLIKKEMKITWVEIQHQKTIAIPIPTPSIIIQKQKIFSIIGNLIRISFKQKKLSLKLPVLVGVA